MKKSISGGLSLSQQMYVEVIWELVDEHGHAHSAEIARRMRVRKPTVTEAVNRLIKLGIARRVDQEVTLTRKGVTHACELAHRHEILRRFMLDILQLPSGKSDAMACKLEHSADPELISRLVQLEEFFQQKGSVSVKKRWRRFLEEEDARRGK